MPDPRSDPYRSRHLAQKSCRSLDDWVYLEDGAEQASVVESNRRRRARKGHVEAGEGATSLSWRDLDPLDHEGSPTGVSREGHDWQWSVERVEASGVADACIVGDGPQPTGSAEDGREHPSQRSERRCHDPRIARQATRRRGDVSQLDDVGPVPKTRITKRGSTERRGLTGWGARGRGDRRLARTVDAECPQHGEGESDGAGSPPRKPQNSAHGRNCTEQGAPRRDHPAEANTPTNLSDSDLPRTQVLRVWPRRPRSQLTTQSVRRP